MRHRLQSLSYNMYYTAAALSTGFRATATPPRPSSILSRLEAGRGSAVRTWAAGCMTASSTNRDEQDRTKRHRSCACERIACLTALCQAHRTRSSHCSYVPSNEVHSVYTGLFITRTQKSVFESKHNLARFTRGPFYM